MAPPILDRDFVPRDTEYLLEFLGRNGPVLVLVKRGDLSPLLRIVEPVLIDAVEPGRQKGAGLARSDAWHLPSGCTLAICASVGRQENLSKPNSAKALSSFPNFHRRRLIPALRAGAFFYAPHHCTVILWLGISLFNRSID
ncbi:MAG: hypothetical protein RLT05_27985 [Bauldia litoralis]